MQVVTIPLLWAIIELGRRRPHYPRLEQLLITRKLLGIIGSLVLAVAIADVVILVVVVVERIQRVLCRA